MKLKIDIAAKDNQPIIALVIGLIIVAALFFMFIMMPLFKRIAALASQEKTMAAKLQSGQAVAKDKERLAAEVKTIEEKIAFLESRLPPDVDVARMLEQLIRLGKDADITFVSLEPQEIKRISIGEAGTGYAEITIKLNVRSAYHAFGRFVTAIENSQRFMSVGKIKIQNNNSDENRHDISLVVNAYALEGGRHALLP